MHFAFGFIVFNIEIVYVFIFIGLQKWLGYSERYPTELFIYAMPFSCGHNLHLFFVVVHYILLPVEW